MEERKKSVADMITAFNSPPRLPPQSQTDGSPQKMSPVTKNKIVSSRSNNELSKESSSLQNTTPSVVTAGVDQRLTRTMEHFIKTASSTMRTPIAHNAPVIRPMGYQNNLYSSAKTLPSKRSKPMTNIEKHPGSVEKHPGSVEKHPGSVEKHPGSVEKHSGSVEKHPGSVEKHPSSVEKHPGGVYYRRTSVKSGSSKRSSSSSSVPSSPKISGRIKQAGGVWYPPINSPQTDTKHNTALRRSKSFTSRVSFDIVPKKVIKRSSVVFNVSSESDNDTMSNNNVVEKKMENEKKKLPPPKPLPKPSPRLPSKSTTSSVATSPKQNDSEIKLSVRDRVSKFSVTKSNTNSKPTCIKKPPIPVPTPITTPPVTTPPVTTRPITTPPITTPPITTPFITTPPITTPPIITPPITTPPITTPPITTPPITTPPITTPPITTPPITTPPITTPPITTPPITTPPITTPVSVATPISSHLNKKKCASSPVLKSKSDPVGSLQFDCKSKDISTTNANTEQNTKSSLDNVHPSHGSSRSVDSSPSRMAIRKADSPLFIPVTKNDTLDIKSSHSLPNSSKSVQSMIAKFSDNSTPSRPTPTNQVLNQSSPILKRISLTSDSSGSDDDDELSSSEKLRIPSVKESDDDKELEIQAFNGLEIQTLQDKNEPPKGSVNHLALDEISSMNAATVEEGFDDDLPLSGNSDVLSSSPIYSYQQYTLKHKQNRSISVSSIGNNAEILAKTLEMIPENDSTIVPSSPQPCVTKLQPDVPVSSSDSERELVRKMSSVSLSFYKEVLETINDTIGQANNQTVDESEHINQVVDEIIRNSHRKVSDSENIYETVEEYSRESVIEYSRKVSDFIMRQRERERNGDDNELPPELPPRPMFLVKLSENEPENISILNDSEQNHHLLSPKKRKSPRRTTKKKSPDLCDDEMRPRIGSCSENTKAVVKKRKRLGSLFKSKIEPKDDVTHSLPSTNFEDVNEYNDCSYENVVSNHRNTIQPINTSESEGEVGLLDQHSEVSSSTGTQSPIKVRWRDDGGGPRPLHDDYPMVTPDSGVFPELQNSRYIRNPLTPPLVTKLGVTVTRPIRFSNSDPALHTTLLLSSRKNNFVPESPSFSVESDCDLTPSISSFESGKLTNVFPVEQQMRSPLMRKRVRSDATSDRPANSSGAIQKNYLLNVALKKRRGSLPGNTETDTIIEVPLVRADVLMDRPTQDADELSFTVNDVIAVLDMTDNDWWQGMVEDRIGWFPASWVRLRIGQEDTCSVDTTEEDTVFNSQQSLSNGHKEATPTAPVELESVVQDSSHDLLQHKRKLSRRMTITKRSTSDFPRTLTSIEIRARCIQEILTTEREYVQHLQDIVEGFLEQCEQHSKLFTPDIIGAIFSNIKEIYRFQKEFLAQLTECINSNKLHNSIIGEVFVKMGEQFCIYSEYCNNHPNAVNEMSILREDPQYTYFFESCRLLRNLTDISLEGFLLTPIQRVCRYPLQLTELVKHTPEDHPDYAHVLDAQHVMTRVAMVINERKRRMENISKVSLWQETVENWKGPDVLERSTTLIQSGELHKISKGHSQERHFFLFDHQMIYCKKDTIGGKLSYKGRVDMDKCDVFDVKDGELTHNGSGLKNCWKMNNADKDDKMYVLYAKSSSSKQQWMNAFIEERRIIAEDNERGFVLTERMKKSAIAIGVATATGPIRRKSISKKSQHMIIDTSTTSTPPADIVGVAQIRSNGDRSNNKAMIGSPNELRKRFKGGKRRL